MEAVCGQAVQLATAELGVGNVFELQLWRKASHEDVKGISRLLAG